MLSTLPEVILDVLCDHLSYEDILMLRCTCKSLKIFVDSKRFTTLHLFVRKFPFPRRLFYTGETVGYSHSLHWSDFSILRSRRLREQFANLQKMTIYRRYSYADSGFCSQVELNLNDLNCFSELTQLEINFEICEIKGKLNLPKLQISAFQGFARSGSFELDCPKLRALKIKLDHKVTLSSVTDQLDYLHYDLHYDLTSIDPLKNICPNLRKLSTIVFEKGDFLLKFLTDLQTGSLHVPLLSQIRLEDCGCLGPLDEVASSLEDLKNDPRTEHITFILMGRPIHSPDELRPIAELKRVYEVENFESYMLYLREALESIRVDMNELGEEEFNQYMRGNELDTRNLKGRSLLFLKRHPELQFLLASTRAVRLDEDIELDEEMIKKLKNVTRLEFGDLFRPSDSLTELVIGSCKSLRSYEMYHQTATERLLEIMSKQLLNLEYLSIRCCRHETLKPLTKFRNLEYLQTDFKIERDDLQFLFENSRTLEIIGFPYQKTERENGEGRFVQLLRRTQKPKVHRLTILGEPKQYFYFDTLRKMIENYTNDFEQLENYEESTRL